MPSSFFDETLAQRYENAEFNFPASPPSRETRRDMRDG